MPEPGDLITAFSTQPGRCSCMIYSHQLQADHSRQPPAWKGIWTDAKEEELVRRGVSGACAQGECCAVGGLLRVNRPSAGLPKEP
jgi:hypothetical protein